MYKSSTPANDTTISASTIGHMTSLHKEFIYVAKLLSGLALSTGPICLTLS